MIYCQSGQVVFCDGTADLMTVLGSCVSVCAKSVEGDLGVMTHFNLPYYLFGVRPKAAYGEFAMASLFSGLVQLGFEPHRFQYSVYGGADFENGTVSIGGENVKFAFSYLLNRGLNVSHSDVGGCLGRKVIMNKYSKNCYVQELTLPLGEIKW